MIDLIGFDDENTRNNNNNGAMSYAKNDNNKGGTKMIPTATTINLYIFVSLLIKYFENDKY